MKFIIVFTFLMSSNSFSSDFTRAKTIINASCTACHQVKSSAQNFHTLESENDWFRAGLIVPGNPDASPLINRLKNFGNNPSVNNMPPANGVALSNSEYQELRTWISSLDQNNFNSSNPAGPQSSTEIDYDIGIDVNSLQSQLKIYKKCYQQFTNSMIPLDDPLLKEVIAQKKSADDACIELLELAELKGGEIQTELGQSILESFHSLHTSWFPSRSYYSAVGSTRGRYMPIFHDVTMPTLYLNQALFGGKEFRTVITSDMPLESIREQVHSVSQGSVRSSNVTSYFDSNNNEVPRVPMGRIIGVKEKESFEISPSSTRYTGSTRKWQGESEADLFSHYGAGIIGSTPYLIANSESYIMNQVTGGLQTGRILSKSIINQFLCRVLPVIRQGDQSEFVHENLNSPLPYRNSTSCMQCHATIDPMAGTARNLQYYDTKGSFTLSDKTMPIGFVGEAKITLPSENLYEWPDAVKDFHKRPPIGKLYYRSYNGKLVNEEVYGLGGLGRALAEQDDVYACMASRYFKHLTGIEVELSDLGDINSRTPSSKEMDYRTFVIELGKNLKNDQSIKKLIHRIIKSKAYLKPGLGVK